MHPGFRYIAVVLVFLGTVSLVSADVVVHEESWEGSGSDGWTHQTEDSTYWTVDYCSSYKDMPTDGSCAVQLKDVDSTSSSNCATKNKYNRIRKSFDMSNYDRIVFDAITRWSSRNNYTIRLQDGSNKEYLWVEDDTSFTGYFYNQELDVSSYTSTWDIIISQEGMTSGCFDHNFAVDNMTFYSSNSAPDKPSNPRPAKSTGTSPASSSSPDLKVDVNDPDGDSMDVDFYNLTSTSAVVGESGIKLDLDDHNWYSVSLSESYGSTPYVFATTQTTRGGQNPSAAHVRGVSASGFETQHCEYDASDTCDNHNKEDQAWFAVDPSDISSIDGMDAGTITTTSGSGGYSISFDSSISTTPLLFTNVQTDAGEDSLNTQAYNIDSGGATVEFCEQENTDSCDSHVDETVAWLAIDPSKIDRKAGFDYGTFTTGDSNWQSISFSESFSSTPAVIADVQTESGGEEALYPEVDNVGTGGADIRYCESEGNDNCDNHNVETVAWLALEPGPFKIEQNNSQLIGTDTVSGSGTASVEWTGLKDGETYNWYTVADDGLESTESDIWEFDVDINNPPQVVDLIRPDGITVKGNDTVLRAEVSDPDSSDSLTVEFYNNRTGSVVDTASASGGGSTVVEGVWSSGDQTRGDHHWWHVQVNDGAKSDQSDENASYYVNDLPDVYDPVPADNALVDDSDVTLEVTSTDPEGSDVTVYFFNDTDDELIGKSDTDASDEASTLWKDREIGNTYEWYVKASDGFENLTSIRWSFKRSLSGGFRPITRINHRYTSIVAGPDSPAYFSFTVENRIAESKNLNTSLSGVNAEFLDGGWYRVYNLGPEARKRFQIKVSPRKPGRFKLDVKTENQDLGISQTDSIPVYSRDAESKSVPRNVPGIGIIQIVFIVAVSTVLVSASL